MPKITFNKPYVWISQDDYVAQPWQIIEWNNITWLRTGYGWTLWPKPTSVITTTEMMYWQAAIEYTTWAQTQTLYGWVWGKIYKWDTWVLVYTLTTWENIIGSFQFGNYFRFMSRENIAWTNFNINRVPYLEAILWNFTNMAEWWNWTSFWFAIWTPPVIIKWAYIYIWSLRGIKLIDSSDVVTSYSIWDDYVTWLTLQGTMMKVFCYNGKVYYWNRNTTSVDTSTQNLGLWIREVSTQWRFDHIIHNDWTTRIMAWYQDNETSMRKYSNRLSNNSIYETKFSLAPPLDYAKWWNASVLWKYFTSNDTEPWIYVYDNLIAWLPKSFHKILTNSSQWPIDEFGFIINHKRTVTPRIYYSYRSWTNYWVDYIDEAILTTQKDWYLITDVIRWIPNEINRVIRVKMTTSYTSWANFIKLWKRINNWAWVLVRTINNTTDTVAVEEINDITDNFIDIQLKVELHNDLQNDTPPILHDFSLEFDQV